MKCPKCRAQVDDGVDRCTFCGHYFKGSMMEEYKNEQYDPTAGYNPQAQMYTQPVQEPKKSKFRLFKR